MLKIETHRPKSSAQAAGRAQFRQRLSLFTTSNPPLRLPLFIHSSPSPSPSSRRNPARLHSHARRTRRLVVVSLSHSRAVAAARRAPAAFHGDVTGAALARAFGTEVLPAPDAGYVRRSAHSGEQFEFGPWTGVAWRAGAAHLPARRNREFHGFAHEPRSLIAGGIPHRPGWALSRLGPNRGRGIALRTDSGGGRAGISGWVAAPER